MCLVALPHSGDQEKALTRSGEGRRLSPARLDVALSLSPRYRGNAAPPSHIRMLEVNLEVFNIGLVFFGPRVQIAFKLALHSDLFGNLRNRLQHALKHFRIGRIADK